MLNSINRNNGSALITALLITAVVAAIAAIMAIRQQIDVRETSLTINADKAYLDLQGIQYWAQASLNNLKKQKNPPLATVFPIKMPQVTNFNHAKLHGTIIDAQGLFNINSLANTNNQMYFIRLLEIVDPKIKKEQAIAIAKAVTEWLVPSNADDIYLKQKPPYRAAHRTMASISELRLVAGMTSTLYQAVKPYITVLPIHEIKININTAPAVILMMLNPKLTFDQAKMIVHCRQNAPIANCIGKLDITFKHTISTSHYFLLRGSVKIGSQYLNSYSLLKTAIGEKGNPVTHVLWRSFQTL